MIDIIISIPLLFIIPANIILLVLFEVKKIDEMVEFS